MRKSETENALRILLVDDSEFDREMFRDAFKNIAPPVTIVGTVSGESALELLEESPDAFDILVSDYKMPGLSGLELYREIRLRKIDLPVALLTGQGNEELVIEALRSGISDYFVKDIHCGYLKLLPIKLPEIVRRHHDQRARRQAERALENQRRLISFLLSAIPNPVLYTDNDGHCLDCNAAFEAFSGIAAEDLLGRVIFDLAAPERAGLLRERFYALATSSEKRESYEEEIIDAKGEKRAVIVHQSAFREDDNRVTGVIAVITDITEHKRNAAELETYRHHLLELVRERTQALRRSERKFRELSVRITRAEQTERQRIAAGLHDGLAQDLALSKIKLQTLKSRLSDASVNQELNGVVSLMEDSIQKLKSLIFELYPPVLFELGLEAALEKLVEIFQEKHRLRCVFLHDRKPKPLSNDKAEALFSAVRELLTNIVKHAEAKNAEITAYRVADRLVLCVKDDGRGFQVPIKNRSLVENRGFGLFHLKGKIENLGGDFKIRSRKNKGSEIIMSALLDENA